MVLGWASTALSAAQIGTQPATQPAIQPPARQVPAVAESEASYPAIRWTLGDGLRARWGSFEARVRPRFHFDYVDPRFREIEEATGSSFTEDTDVRRARLLGDFGFREESLLRDWSVRAQVDFADSDIRWLDLAGTYAGLPTIETGAVGRVRFGQFRESFGLEAMTSVSHLAFIERSTASNAFTPGRSRGVEWSETGDATMFQLGAFRRADGEVFPNELQEESAVTARALWLRGRDHLGGIQLVQLGASISVRDPGADQLRFDARPGSRLFDRIVDSGSLDADGAVTMGLEALTQWGQSTLVAEIFGADVRGVSNGAGTSASGGVLSGAHVGFTTFLTSGHAARWNRRRGGLRSAAVGDAIFGEAPTNGALEAAVRLSWVNLDSGPVQGGQSADLEAGLNWYLQPTTRFMLHWLGTRATGASGRTGFGHAILARIQVQL